VTLIIIQIAALCGSFFAVGYSLANYRWARWWNSKARAEYLVVTERAAQIDAEIEATKQSIRDGARRSKGRFHL
jgi:hypothetical protein